MATITASAAWRRGVVRAHEALAEGDAERARERAEATLRGDVPVSYSPGRFVSILAGPHLSAPRRIGDLLGRALADLINPPGTDR